MLWATGFLQALCKPDLNNRLPWNSNAVFENMAAKLPLLLMQRDMTEALTFLIRSKKSFQKSPWKTIREFIIFKCIPGSKKELTTKLVSIMFTVY